MVKTIRISVTTAALYSFALAVTATPAAAQNGVTIPNGPLAGGSD